MRVHCGSVKQVKHCNNTIYLYDIVAFGLLHSPLQNGHEAQHTGRLSRRLRSLAATWVRRKEHNPPRLSRVRARAAAAQYRERHGAKLAQPRARVLTAMSGLQRNSRT